MGREHSSVFHRHLLGSRAKEWTFFSYAAAGTVLAFASWAGSARLAAAAIFPVLVLFAAMRCIPALGQKLGVKYRSAGITLFRVLLIQIVVVAIEIWLYGAGIPAVVMIALSLLFSITYGLEVYRQIEPQASSAS